MVRLTRRSPTGQNDGPFRGIAQPVMDDYNLWMQRRRYDEYREYAERNWEEEDQARQDDSTPSENVAADSQPQRAESLASCDSDDTSYSWRSGRVAADLDPVPRLGSETTPRKIVILLDGTGNRFSDRNSNVLKTLSCLASDDDQLVYFSSGVGTVLPDQASTWGRLRSKMAKVTDMMFAWNHVELLCNAYKYLMDHYKAGDQVFILGFSRGAYTARCLAGMIQKIGLLPPGNHNQIQLAYQVYMKDAKKGEQSQMKSSPKNDEGKHSGIASHGGRVKQDDPAMVYRQMFGVSRPVQIDFVGVWDTVSSLGGMFLPRLPAAGVVQSARFFRQALALDERRARFAPEYQSRNAADEVLDPAKTQPILAAARELFRSLAPRDEPDTAEQRRNIYKKLAPLLGGDAPVIAMTYPITVTDGNGRTGYIKRILPKRKEVWFMGSHSDVGGGNDLNQEDSLSNIPFRWMLREAVQCGVKLDAKGVALQPAIRDSLLVRERHMIPDELVEMLDEQLRGEVYCANAESHLKALVNRLLPDLRLLQIVELAAASDTAIRTAVPGARHDVGSAAGGEIGGKMGLEVPIGPDGLNDIKESLTLAWMPLEAMVMQTRDHSAAESGEKDVWRANLSRPRQMQDGQTIHRSVLKRFLHYRSTTGPSETTSNKAGSPDAQQAPSFSAVPALGMSSQKVGLREPRSIRIREVVYRPNGASAGTRSARVKGALNKFGSSDARPYSASGEADDGESS